MFICIENRGLFFFLIQHDVLNSYLIIEQLQQKFVLWLGVCNSLVSTSLAEFALLTVCTVFQFTAKNTDNSDEAKHQRRLVTRNFLFFQILFNASQFVFLCLNGLHPNLIFFFHLRKQANIESAKRSRKRKQDLMKNLEKEVMLYVFC